MSCSTTTSECVAGEREEQLGGALGLLVGHAGDRLVEQQQLGLLHQQHADLEPLLLAVREQARGTRRLPLQAGSCPASRRCGRVRVRRGATSSVGTRACRPCSASSRFSNTVCCSNTVGFWNLRPMPARAISGSVRRVRSMVWPKNAVPASGRVLPVMTSIIVVLPAPFGPMTQRSSPASIVERKLVERLEAVEADRDVVEIQDAAMAWCRRPRRGTRAPLATGSSPIARGLAAALICAFSPLPSRAPATPRGRNSVTRMNSSAERRTASIRETLA